MIVKVYIRHLYRSCRVVKRDGRVVVSHATCTHGSKEA